jgi:hypothetical protein
MLVEYNIIYVHNLFKDFFETLKSCTSIMKNTELHYTLAPKRISDTYSSFQHKL